MTFTSTPAAYSSVNDSLVWVVYDAHSTNPVTYPNYKYVAECWINGTKIDTSRKFQNPTNNCGEFDFSTAIREYIQVSLAPLSSGVLAKQMAQGEFAIDVVIKIREEYNGTIGAVILTDSTRTFFNHYNARTSELTILSSLAAKPLSTRQVNIEMFYENDNFFLPYFAPSSASFNVVVTGASTHTKSIVPTQLNSLQLLNISPSAINTEWANTINSALQSYTVAVGGTTYICNLVCEPISTNYPIHFLNKYGGFETFNFYKTSRKTYEIERKIWKQPSYRVDGSGVFSIKTGNIMHEQKSTFGVRFTEKLKVSTNLLNDVDWQFLKQLIVSPLIYVQDGTTLYPVTIEQSNYEEKQIQIDSWENLELELSFGTTYKTQYR